MRYLISCIIYTGLFITCGVTGAKNIVPEPTVNDEEAVFVYDTGYIAVKFRIPVGNPPGRGYYDAQPFMKNTHLGEDWNGTGGGNSDLGDTVYACANGYITYAKDIAGGWGKVIRILHQLPGANQYKQVESLYAHFDTLFVTEGIYVKIGSPIGTIGTANGIYPAHLHFEIRYDVNMEIGGGYSSDTSGYLDPKVFIREFNQKN